MTTICNDADLTDAVHYFDAGGGDNASMTSLSSLSSYQDLSGSKMVMRIRVAMGYDGPSLSDTASLMSTDDGASMWGASDTPGSDTPDESDTPDSDSCSASDSGQGTPSFQPHDAFERLRRAEVTPGGFRPRGFAPDDRGAAWLKEQNSRSVQHVLEMLPPSPSSEWSFSLNGSMTSDGHDEHPHMWYDSSITPRGGTRGGPTQWGASPRCPKATLKTITTVANTYAHCANSVFAQGPHPLCNGCGQVRCTVSCRICSRVDAFLFA